MQLTSESLLTLARAAHVDTRTLSNYLIGIRVRATSERRIKEALARWGVQITRCVLLSPPVEPHEPTPREARALKQLEAFDRRAVRDLKRHEVALRRFVDRPL